VKCALATLPREWLIESVASELSDDELDAQIVCIREQLAKSQEPLLIEAKVADVPARRVRIRNIMPVIRDYSRASQSF
jgi:hypothetical protein